LLLAWTVSVLLLMLAVLLTAFAGAFAGGADVS
jgi:hypothetical protein